MAKASTPKTKKSFIARGKFVAGDRVHLLLPPAKLAATSTYRPGAGTVIDVEPPFDGWEVMTVRWDDGDPTPVKYWPNELLESKVAAPTPVPGLAKAEKTPPPVDDLEQYDD